MSQLLVSTKREIDTDLPLDQHKLTLVYKKNEKLIDALMSKGAGELVSLLLFMVEGDEKAQTKLSAAVQFDPCQIRQRIVEIDELLDSLSEALGDGDDPDWLELENEVFAFLDKLEPGSPNMVASIEYIFGRTLCFLWVSCKDLYIDQIRDIERCSTNFTSRLQKAHVEQLQASGADPERLAELLAHWQLDYELPAPTRNAIEAYQSILTDSARSRYREIVKRAYEKHVNENDCEYFEGCDASLFVLKAFHDTGAEMEIDETCLARLSNGSDYFGAMESSSFHKMDWLAEQLAYRGLETLAGDNFSIGGLRMCLAERCIEKGDPDKATDHMLEQFKAEPTYKWFHELQDFCSYHKEIDWQSLKNQMIEYMEQTSGNPVELFKMHDGSSAPCSGCQTKRDSSTETLIELKIKEKDYAEAWQLVTNTCSNEVLLKLGKFTQEISIETVSEIIKPRVEQLLNEGTEDSRFLATELLNIMFRTADDTSKRQEFRAYLKELKERFALKGKASTVLRRFGM